MSTSEEKKLRIQELLKEQNYELARDFVCRDIEENSLNDELYFELAKIYHLMERNTDAFMEMNRAINLNKNNQNYKLWSLLFASLERRRESDELYRELQDASGQLADVAIGEYYYFRLNYTEAYKRGASAYKHNSVDVDAVMLMIKCMDALNYETSEIEQKLTEIQKNIFDYRILKLELKMLYKHKSYELCEKKAKKICRMYPNTDLSENANEILRKTRRAIRSEKKEPKIEQSISEEDDTEQERMKVFNQTMRELNDLIGLDEVKNQINMICKKVLFEKKRESMLKEKYSSFEKKKNQTSYHFVFSGNPGTGKTTVARMFGKIFYGLGILEEGQLVETDRSGLVGEYIGATAQKTQEMVKKAMGGVLFIDEAYSLYNTDGGKQDFGTEAIDTLVKAIEDNRDKFIVILAGYKDEMKELMKANPGLESRFTKFVEFPDYSEEDLLRIAEKICEENAYTLSEDGKLAFIYKIKKCKVDDRFGNARTVRNIVNNAFERKAFRTDLKELSLENITMLEAEDFDVDLNEKPEEKAAGYINELDALIGLESVKSDIGNLIDTINYQREEQKRIGAEVKMPNLHMVFQGNPGTGKTTVAKIYGNILRELGILAKGQFIEAGRAELVGQYQGQTATLVKEKCRDAYGGVLFIDEAYSLCTDDNDSFGKEAISTLIKEMEDNREKLVVILAGYTKEMEEFLNRNSGFKSRISKYLNFEDYTAEEMLQIFILYCKNEHIVYDDSLLVLVKGDMERMEYLKDMNFGNARDVRKYFEKVRMAMYSRVQHEGIVGDDRRKLVAEDLK